MNKLDLDYQNLLKDILENGVKKETRNGGTLSVFGRQIRHSMKDGFPLLTTKKMYFKGIVVELLWFLRGDTSIKYLLDNDCHIWDGDAYKNYLIEDAKILPNMSKEKMTELGYRLTQEEFINKIKTDNEFAKKWGELGPVYGKQWRNWGYDSDKWREEYKKLQFGSKEEIEHLGKKGIDQISDLIKQLKENPDSRRLLLSAWNASDLPNQVLPPCHYGFQVYTRELSDNERTKLYEQKTNADTSFFPVLRETLDFHNIPKRAISLMWNQRSVDTFLGLPFNIASYGLLLEIIAKEVNMVPDELIGNLGDVHLYSNHIEQAKEQIGRDLTDEERYNIWFTNNYETGMEKCFDPNNLPDFDNSYYQPTPKRTREPYPLPRLNINTEFWPYEGGSCGEGPLDAMAVFESFKDANFCKCLLEEDIQLGNYQSHPTIKAPLSN